MNENKKISTLDLAKTLSDFLFLWVKNPEERARKVFELKHSLTPHWFEKYIEYFLKNIKGYKITLNWDTYDFDNWIDLKWIKYKNWKKSFVLIQCKKYSVRDITEDDIACFYGKIIDNIRELRDVIDVYFITTTKFTHRAEKFGNDRKIELMNCNHIYRLQEIYSLEMFKNDVLKEWKEEYKKCLRECEKILDLYDNYFNIIEPTQTELFNLLKQVRKDYWDKNQLRLWDVATNETLEILAKKRPHDLEELKKVSLSINNYYERMKVMKYGGIFIDRLKYFKVVENNNNF